MNIGTTSVAALLALVSFGGGHLRGHTAPEPAVSVAVVGDSYAAGYGADRVHAWEAYTGLELGWSVDAVRAYPGAGYVNPGAGGAPYETALAQDPLPSTVSQVIVQGGFNDIAYDPAQVTAAVSRTLAVIRAQAPQATITVLGTFDPGPGTFDAQYPNLRGDAPLVEQAVEAAGDRYIDGLQFRYEVSADRVHPTPAGHAQLGYAIADAIEQAAPQDARPTAQGLRSIAASTIGVSRVEANGARYFYLAPTTGGALGRVTGVAFGDAGDIPTLLPNAAGTCTPAVYRPSTGTLYLASAAVDGGGSVIAIPFGSPGDQPVQNAASVTSDGRTAAIRRPATGTFYEQVRAADGGTDVGSLAFGDGGDRGFLYSATGVGTTVGVYRPNTSTFYLADPGHGPVSAAAVVPFGDPGDQGLVGAWGWGDTDGSDRVGVFRPSEGRWYLAKPSGAVTSFAFGNPGDTALACDPE